MNSTISSGLGKVITAFTKKEALLPVVALEATVVGGRTIQAKKRGGRDESRERLIEELSGSVVWLWGVQFFNFIGNKIMSSILKLKDINVDVGKDIVRDPFKNYMNNLGKTRPEISSGALAACKAAKVLMSVVAANLVIGMAVPKFNHMLTNKKRSEEEKGWFKLSPEQQSEVKCDTSRFKQFMEKQNNAEKSANPSFTSAMSGINVFTNFIENTSTGKLLSCDIGVMGGRTINARRKEERREILIRDGGSIYFYMWAAPHIGKLMNLAESGGKYSNRLNPNAANLLNQELESFLSAQKTTISAKQLGDFLTTNGNPINEAELETFLTSKGNSVNTKEIETFLTSKGKNVKVQDIDAFLDASGRKISSDAFRSAFLGADKIELPKNLEFTNTEKQSGITKLFNKFRSKPKKPIQTIETDKFLEFLKANSTEAEYERLSGIAKEMTKLQPARDGVELLTREQVKDIYRSGQINKPEFLKKAFEFESGGASSMPNKYYSHKQLYKFKKQMVDYVKDMCDSAQTITKETLQNAKSKNLKLNGLNFLAGFAVSALFLSTLIPKFQYYVTKTKTGVDAFPGTYDYEQNQNNQTNAQNTK